MSTHFTLDVPAGPIWDNEDAQITCPIACASHNGTWNGQWTTVVDGKMSVCGCEMSVEIASTDQFTVDVPAGPIWDNEDAQITCPIACASHNGTWNGQWTTVVEGKMSVCGCVMSAG